MRALTALLLTLLTAAPACAADLTLVVRTPRGAPVADAVVTVLPASGGGVPRSYGQPLRMVQRQMRFEPFVLVAPVGAEVAFPNEDAVRHQVYSFSPAKKFELKLYGRDQSRTVRFDKAGTVSVGCNIHDSMVGFVKVVDAPFAAKTDGAGRVVLHGLPAGAAVVRVWHPYLKAPASELRLDVALPAQGGVERAVVGEVRSPPMASGGY